MEEHELNYIILESNSKIIKNKVDRIVEVIIDIKVQHYFSPIHFLSWNALNKIYNDFVAKNHVS